MRTRLHTDNSRRLLEVLVNDRPELLEEAVRDVLSVEHNFQWLSPLASDGFRMYRDAGLLRRLDVELDHRPLKDFWPARGPRWGGLARSGAKVLLFESAKDAEEFDTSCRASPASLEKIHLALAETKDFLGASPEADWTSHHYRYANRLAHLYLLRELNGIDATLVFVCFTGGSASASVYENRWREALDDVASSMLLPQQSDWLTEHVRVVFVDISEMGEPARASHCDGPGVVARSFAKADRIEGEGTADSELGLAGGASPASPAARSGHMPPETGRTETAPPTRGKSPSRRPTEVNTKTTGLGSEAEKSRTVAGHSAHNADKAGGKGWLNTGGQLLASVGRGLAVLVAASFALAMLTKLFLPALIGLLVVFGVFYLFVGNAAIWAFVGLCLIYPLLMWMLSRVEFLEDDENSSE